MRRKLIGCIDIKCLNKNNLKDFITEITLEDIFYISSHKEKENLWNQLREVLLNSYSHNFECEEDENIIYLKHSDVKNVTGIIEEDCIQLAVKHNNGDDFNGIIKYLENLYGQNINEQGIVHIKASSTDHNSPEQVIDYEWNDYWDSYYERNEWWKINFKKRRVKMMGYSIKTFSHSIGSRHLKNWVIEGKNRGHDWEEIDRQINNYDLNGPSYQCYFSLPEITKPYQSFRIKMIGKTHDEDCSYLVLANFEIFGNIM